MNSFKITTVVLICVAAVLLSGCQGGVDGVFGAKEKRPIPQRLLKKIEAKGMTAGSPILLRIFKTENVLEVWKAKVNGRYDMLESYEICKWSGKLGPKYKEGDRQAPEGFYKVTPAQMNPRSSYHLAFNMGYPNAYDRAHNRTGTHLMVHGACSSAGCYSMTDEYVEEIYSLARESFANGQRDFQIQAYPFRMTPENMVKHVDHPEFEFWKMLKEGNDHFEVNQSPPKVDVCEQRYVFNRIANDEKRFSSRAECPASVTSSRLALALTSKQKEDQKIFDKILTKQIKSPFVPKEEKPKTKSASILATPTIGELSLVEPQKPEPVEPPKSEAQVETVSADQPSAVPTTTAPATTVPATGPNRVAGEATQPGQVLLLDPISQEAAAQPEAVKPVQQEVPASVTAVPQRAPRQPSG